MTTEISIMFGTGRNDNNLSLTQFYGGSKKGLMLQLTQGFGCSGFCKDPDEPGFIQLTKRDALILSGELEKWGKS